MNRPKILAIGDIHIFNSKRFEEHRHVFANLRKVVERENPGLIVICGDVIDSKLRLSPEQIALCREFFQMLRLYAPVIVIPGNHDLNLQNKERLDSLTPIINSIDVNDGAQGLHYFKNSGFYRFEDLEFAVWSCIDDQLSPFNVGKPETGYVIGLYHGVVSGCTTDDGFALSGGVEIDEFKDCQMVIMADIHKQQSFRNGEINYTGSLIQASVSEAPHGSCLTYDWDGNKYQPQVHRVQNDYSTISINVDDAMVKKPLPTQKVRLKFDTDKVTRVQAVEMAKQLKETLSVKVDIVPIVKKKDTSIKLSTNSPTIDISNVGDYMEEFVKANKARLEVSDTASDLPKLKQLDKNFSAGEMKGYEQGDYFVQKLVLDNFLSFGPSNNEIDLSKTGLLGIVGKNRVGKSSIIKAIQFCLFNETPSNSSALKLINKYNRSKPASVEIHLSKNNKLYRIKRKITPDKKGLKVSSDLSFHEMDEYGTEIMNLTKESRPYTEVEISKYLGINETFEMLSLFSAQKKQVEFIDCKNADRLKLVNKFLGNHSFELKEENVLQILKEKNAVFSTLSKQFDKDVNIFSLERDIKKSGLLLKMAKNDINELGKEMIELELDYMDILTMYNSNLKASTKKISEPTELKGQISDMEDETKKLEDKIISNNELIKQHQQKGDQLVSKFEQDHGIHPADFSYDSSRRDTAKNELAVLRHEYARLEKQIRIDTCNTCGKEFSDEDKKECQEKLFEYTERIGKLAGQIDLCNAEEKSAQESIWVLEQLLDTIDNIQERDNLRLEGRIKDIRLKISDVQTQIVEYDRVEESKNIVNMLSERVSEYNITKHDLKAQMDAQNSNVGFYTNKVNEAESKMSIYIDKVRSLEELEEEIRLLKAYRKIVSKDGLPLYILKSKIDEINERVNMVVSQVFDFNIDFSIDEDKAELRIQFAYPDESEKNDIGLASGSETFVINLCIKVGLAQISSLPKIDTVFIDEGYDVLDADTMEKLPALFNMLVNYYENVITISHLDVVKDMCVSQVKLERVNKYTVSI